MRRSAQPARNATFLIAVGLCATIAPAANDAAGRIVELAARIQATEELRESQHQGLAHLEQAVATAESDLDRARAHLALANRILAEAVDVATTRWLLGLDAEDDRTLIAGSAERAAENITKAQTLLDQLSRIAKETERPAITRLDMISDALSVFARLFALADEKPDAGDRAERFAELAIELAILREWEDAEVAAASRLWQAFAFELAGRNERALGNLPEAVTPPETWPYDFLARCLRCRILSDHGQHVAAIALAIRMDKLCETWVPDTLIPASSEDDTGACRRLVALGRLRSSLLWREQVAGHNPEAVRQLDELIKGVEANYFVDPTESRVYYLRWAIPLMMESPIILPTSGQPATRPSAPATQPATGTNPAP